MSESELKTTARMIESILEWELDRKFPGVYPRELAGPAYFARGEDADPDAPYDKIVMKAREYRSSRAYELKSLDESELKTIDQQLARETISSKGYQQRYEKQLFFNRPEADADFDHWTQMSAWLIAEAVALSFGKDPQRVNSEYLKELSGVCIFRDLFEKRTQLITRAVSVGDLKDPVRPMDFCSWVKSRNIELPEALQLWSQTVVSKTKNPNDPLVDNQYWNRLSRLAKQAIAKYPKWRNSKNQRSTKATTVPQKYEIERWLSSNPEIDTREANILVKVLTDQFSELNKNQ